ncbi:MAG: radical SAM protein [Polyangiaceae bacterium]|nr:radical SAM protein [Polyangiaceae bacterium]
MMAQAPGATCPEIRVHAIVHQSVSNGPGVRSVVWLQGCSRGCPGCFNPETHPAQGGQQIGASELADELLAVQPSGVSISGGEPFEQPEGLLGLVTQLRQRAPESSLLVFTGYRLEEVRSMPLGRAILSRLDVLVAGPYVESLPSHQWLVGSSNQTIHLLSMRHEPEQFVRPRQIEVVLRPDGTVCTTGFRALLRTVA